MKMYTKINDNHKKLLITIGDSWTEGVGNYDPVALKEFENKKISAEDLYRISTDTNCFYPNSWPVKLSEYLEWDLINLGHGGDANSATAKKFMCDFDEKNTFDFSKYKEVTVMWMLSDPFRFSFYVNERLKSWQAHGSDQILKWYTMDVHKSDQDGWLETKFFLKAVSNYCKVKNYKFIYGVAFSDIQLLNNIYNGQGNIHNYTKYQKIANCLHEDDDWAHCGHPNAQGYVKIADALYDVLTTEFKIK